VTFAAERPGLAPGKARLPEPARKMTRRDAAIVRGPRRFDRAETRLPRSQGSPQADAGKIRRPRGVFEAVEQAPRRSDRLAPDGRRGEKNLTAMLDDHFHRGKFDEITDRARCAAVGCLGDAGARTPDWPGAACSCEKKMVDLWRPVLEDKIGGARLDKLSRVTEDQARFR